MGGTCQSQQTAITPKPAQEISRLLFKPPETIQQPKPLTSVGLISDQIVSVEPLHVAIKDLAKSLQFRDEQFPAQAKSLFRRPDQKFDGIQWRPARSLFPQSPIFQAIDISDINQGALGDCYLLSALASLVKRPKVIEKLFQKQSYRSSGMLAVWINRDGEWKQIILDQMLPCIKNKLIFSNNRGSDLWVPFLEKAYAKALGNYQNIEGGLFGHAIFSLTGAPYQYLCKDHSQKLESQLCFTFIKEGLQKGYLLGASTELQFCTSKSEGLVDHHSYAILDARDVLDSVKKPDRILKLYNPWGKFQWKGKWSDKSSSWTKGVRQQLNFREEEDGVFWMSIKDFVLQFSQVCKCFYHQNYIYNSVVLQGQFPVCLHISTPTEVAGYLTLTQRDHRLSRGLDSHTYSLLKMVLFQVNQQGEPIRFIGDSAQQDKHVSLQAHLSAGNYCLFVEVERDQSFQNYLNVSFYGHHAVILTKTNSAKASRLVEILIPLQIKAEKTRSYEYKIKDIMKYTGQLCGYIYYHYVNDSTQKSLCQLVQFKDVSDLEIISHQRQDQILAFVRPGQKATFLLRAKKLARSCSFSTKIKFFYFHSFNQNQLRAQLLKQPTKIKKREIVDKMIEVQVRFLNFDGGSAILYQNKCSNYTFNEEVQFELQNLVPLNFRNGGITNIELQPGEERLLVMRVDDPLEERQYKMNISFYVTTPEFQF